MNRTLAILLAACLSAVSASAQQRFAPPKVTTLTGLNGNQGDIVNLVGTGDYLCSAATCTSASDWKQITSGGSSGAPTDATYITQTPNSTLSAEQALSTLATGLMNSTTTTGIISTLAPTDDNLVVGSGSAWQLKALTTCTGANKAVTYDASANTFGCNTISAGSGDVVGPGSASDNHVALFNGVTGKLIKDGGAISSGIGSGAYATVTTTLGTANSDIKFTSRFVGVLFDELVITYVDPGLPDQAFALDITYPDPNTGLNIITVNLATDGLSAITTTAQDVIDAFTLADSRTLTPPTAVHTIAVASGGNATGLVAAGSWTLTGGADGVALLPTGFDLSGIGFGSYAGSKTQMHTNARSDAWTLWGGLDDGAGLSLTTGLASLSIGLGDGRYINPFGGVYCASCGAGLALISIGSMISGGGSLETHVELYLGTGGQLNIDGTGVTTISAGPLVVTKGAQTVADTVANLPTCDSNADGMHAAVTDSNAASYTLGIGTVVAAGASTHVPVYCDGTNWRIG